nr:endonuclease/exonuclease/phosphatase family protein [Neorhodopirellula pilleata]
MGSTGSLRAENSSRAEAVRVASMNVSLYGESAGQVQARLASGSDAQAIRLAQIIRTIRPEILLLCEIDHEPDAATLNCFADLYLNANKLGIGGDQSSAIDYPHRWSIPTNTGLIADVDIDSDGRQMLPTDAWGFGVYPGQYAMAVLSRYPIDRDAVRTFQTFRWADLPDALQPIAPETAAPFYPPNVWNKLRLSSKNHADVPIKIPIGEGFNQTTKTIHLLASHPTPPVFDGKEDRNGKRNHDEIRFWHDYLSKPSAEYLIDDSGAHGGLSDDASFVIAGDLNSDPERGDSLQSAIVGLIEHPRIRDARPTSAGHGISTALFGRREVRVDYVLPSRDLTVIDQGVVWPDEGEPLAKAIGASDHRMVWLELQLR